MDLVLVIVVILLIGGGGYFYGPGRPVNTGTAPSGYPGLGGGLLGLIVLVLIIVLLFRILGGHHTVPL